VRAIVKRNAKEKTLLNRRQLLAQSALASGAFVGSKKLGMADNKLKRISLHANNFRFEGFSAGPKNGDLVLFLHGFPQFADAWINIFGPIASLGYHAVAVNQRGYSPGARPAAVEDYAGEKLSSDALGFADFLGAKRFHLVGHDWGGAVAWVTAAHAPDRLTTLTVLSTPHPDALFAAIQSDPDQQRRSSYFQLFQAPNHAAEKTLLADHAKILRGAYMGKVPAVEVDSNVRRFERDGTLTAALNWYRAKSFTSPLGPVHVPTMYVWGDQDQALGETAAVNTAKGCTGPYRFERLKGKSHWLMDECPETIVNLLHSQLGSPKSDPNLS
jgi:pimeloyl-ACP methyl ester carboxylesterase